MFDKLIDLLVSAWNRLNPVVFIMQCDQGIVLRGGRLHRVLYPGTYFRFPGIDIINTTNVKNLTICIREVNVTTADGKAISIAAKFNCVIKDIVKAMIETNNWQANIVDVGRGIMSKQLVKYTWEEICNSNVDEKIGALIDKEAELIGLRMSKFEFTDKLIIRGFKLFNA